MGKRVTGRTFQRPQEERRPAGAGVEEWRRTGRRWGAGQGRGQLSSAQAFRPPGVVLAVPTGHPALRETGEVPVQSPIRQTDPRPRSHVVFRFRF